MSYSPGLVLKKPGRPPLKATHFYSQTQTPDSHIQSPCPPTKIKTSRQRKHPFGRISPPESRTRINKLTGIHRTGSLGSLDRSLKCFASPHLFPPSPILPHSHIRSQKPTQTDNDCNSGLRKTDSASRVNRSRPIRSTSLDSADSPRVVTATPPNCYFDPLNPTPLPVYTLTVFPAANISDNRRISMEEVDQQISIALEGLSITNQSEPDACPDGHVAPAPFVNREVRSAGANISPRCKLYLSPAETTLARESSGSACSSAPECRSQTFLKSHPSSPRCRFNGEPPHNAISVEMRVASMSGMEIQAPDPVKVGVVLTGAIRNSGFVSASSAFKPIHQFQDGKPTTLST